MQHSFEQFLRRCFSRVGLEVRRTNNLAGADPLGDIKKLHVGPDFKTVIDVGANVGQSAMRFCRAFPGAAVHSFEPVAASHRAGQCNTAAHPEITWHHNAVGNANERLTFYSSSTSQANSVTKSEAGPAGSEGERNEVEMIRLDDFFQRQGIETVDLLKTDTEGHDLAVLQGAENALKERRVGYVICEVGFTEADKGHSFFPLVAAYLESLGYRLVSFYGFSGVGHFRQLGITYADALFAVPRQP